jgi:hypothetical protein
MSLSLPPLTLKEEHKLRVFQIRVLMRISLNIIRAIKSRMRWARHAACTERYEKCIQYCGWKTGREEPTRKA